MEDGEEEEEEGESGAGEYQYIELTERKLTIDNTGTTRKTVTFADTIAIAAVEDDNVRAEPVIDKGKAKAVFVDDGGVPNVQVAANIWGDESVEVDRATYQELMKLKEEGLRPGLGQAGESSKMGGLLAGLLGGGGSSGAGGSSSGTGRSARGGASVGGGVSAGARSSIGFPTITSNKPPGVLPGYPPYQKYGASAGEAEYDWIRTSIAALSLSSSPSAAGATSTERSPRAQRIFEDWHETETILNKYKQPTAAAKLEAEVTAELSAEEEQRRAAEQQHIEEMDALQEEAAEQAAIDEMDALQAPFPDLEISSEDQLVSLPLPNRAEIFDSLDALLNSARGHRIGSDDASETQILIVMGWGVSIHALARILIQLFDGSEALASEFYVQVAKPSVVAAIKEITAGDGDGFPGLLGFNVDVELYHWAIRRLRALLVGDMKRKEKARAKKKRARHNKRR